MVFLELKKSSPKMKKNIRNWFEYFRAGEVAEDAPEYVREACELASYQNLREEEKNMISAREKAEQDAYAREAYRLRVAEERGMEQGLEQGREYNLVRLATIVQRMLGNGKSIQEIEELTGITSEEIEGVLK